MLVANSNPVNQNSDTTEVNSKISRIAYCTLPVCYDQFLQFVTMRTVKKGCLLLFIFLAIAVLLFNSKMYRWYDTEKENNGGSVSRPRRAERSSNVNIHLQEFSSHELPRELRQKERRKLVEKFCEKTGHNRMPPLTHIIVVEPLQLLYCTMPKAASRMWRELLHDANNGKRYTLRRYSPERRKEMLETYFKFTFVREPLERILSAYKDKFVHLRKVDRPILEYHGREILKNFRPNASQSSLEKLDDVTFREFIEYLVTKGSNKTTPVMNWHWDSYVNICGMCAIKYDFIGHYETLARDISDFKEAAGLSPEQAQFFNVDVSNQSDTASSVISYYSQIPLDWIVTLSQILRANFDMFGYSFPGPLKSLFESLEE